MTDARFTHDAMACTFGLQFAGVRHDYAAQAAHAAFAELDRLEALLSRFVPHSDIARINGARAGEFVPVSSETLDCLQLSDRVFRVTGGVFDIAYRSERPRSAVDGRAPPPLVFDPARHAVAPGFAGVVLDLGAVGKGYALDRMAAILRDWSIPGALLHSGQSTVLALGTPAPVRAPEPPAPAQAASDTGLWTVALRAPGDSPQVLGHVQLAAGVALSGSGQQLHGGHIIDPRTGQPAAAAAAWSLADSAALADALSTAFMLLTPREIDGICAAWPAVGALRYRGDPAHPVAACGAAARALVVPPR